MERDLGVGGKHVLIVTCGSSALTRVPGTHAPEAPPGEAGVWLGGRLFPRRPSWRLGCEWGLHTGQEVVPV